MVGGTGLYLQAIIEGWLLPKVKPNNELRKKLEQKTLVQLQTEAEEYNLNESDFHNKRRLIRAIEIHQGGNGKSPCQGAFRGLKKPKYDCLILGLKLPKTELDKKIDQRLKDRLKQGLVKEVENLYKKNAETILYNQQI